MFRLAKGIVTYIGLALIAASSYGAEITKTKDSYDRSCTPYSCTYTPKKTDNCDSELEKKIKSLELNVSLSSQTLKLKGYTPEGQSCTLLEQRVVVGKSGWGTPSISSRIEYAIVNPTWYPTPSLIKEMREKHPPSYFRRFKRSGGQMYMPPGKENPLGKVKFMFPNGFHVRMHGTNNDSRKYFEKKRRFYSHGCIRVEDEVQLLKTINKYAGNTEECNDACIDQKIASNRTQNLKFRDPVKLIINWKK